MRDFFALQEFCQNADKYRFSPDLLLSHVTSFFWHGVGLGMLYICGSGGGDCMCGEWETA